MRLCRDSKTRGVCCHRQQCECWCLSGDADTSFSDIQLFYKLFFLSASLIFVFLMPGFCVNIDDYLKVLSLSRQLWGWYRNTCCSSSVWRVCLAASEGTCLGSFSSTSVLALVFSSSQAAEEVRDRASSSPSLGSSSDFVLIAATWRWGEELWLKRCAASGEITRFCLPFVLVDLSGLVNEPLADRRALICILKMH